MKQWINLPTLLLTASLALWVNQTAWAQENTDNIESPTPTSLKNTTQNKIGAVLDEDVDIWEGMSEQDKQNIKDVFLRKMGHEINEEEIGKFIKTLLKQQDIQSEARSIRDNNKQYTNADIIITLLVWLGGGYFMGMKKQSEDLKKNSKSGLEVFAEAAPWPIVKYREDGYPLIWNPKMAEETGYSHQEVIDYYNKKKRDLSPKEYRFIIMGLLYSGDNLTKVRQYLETGKGYADVKFTMDTKSGEEKTFRWSTVPDPEWGDLRMARNLTDENEFELFAEIAPWPVVKYREDGYPLTWNPKMAEETGYSHQEVIDYYNKKRQDENLPPEECPYIVMTLLYKGENLVKVREYLEKLKNEKWKGYANVTFTLNTKSGEEKTFRWSTVPNPAGGDLRMAQHLTDDQEIHAELAKMREFVRRDGLTNAHTRLALFHDMQELLCNRREEDPVDMSMFFLDIDDFKKINDCQGHEVGDGILKSLVEFLHGHMREGDKIYRYWGDEFIILLKNHNLDKIITKLNNMRHEFHSNTEGVWTSLWVVSFNTADYTKYDTNGKAEEMSKEQVEEITNSLKQKADWYMYAVKYYRLIRKQLIQEGKIQESQPEKNGIAVPQYDEVWNFLGVQVMSDYQPFLITKEQLSTIDRIKKNQKGATQRK